jgi:hypothetical protein
MILTPRAAVDINRIGMVFGFLSFWFAAPEFIGVERLKAWERVLARGLVKFRRLPRSIRKVALMMCFLIPLGFFYVYYGFGANILSHKGSKAVLGSVMSAIAGALVDNLDRIVGTLANDTKARQRSLFIGGVLFAASFVLQFLATF